MTHHSTQRLIRFGATLLLATGLVHGALGDEGESLSAAETPAVSETAPAVADLPSATDAESKLIYTIPIQGAIDKALLYIIRRGLAAAEKAGADAIIFVMDTPGGSVPVMEEIISLLSKLTVPTYTFVESNAISAGAIIALATDYIYMAPGSKIGDAMPIMMSPQGGVQSLGDAEREKIVSYVDTLVRGVAQQKGRDEQLASAMVRREIEYKIGDDVICPEGQILTLTAVEAVREYTIDEETRPLLAEAILNDVDALIEARGLSDAKVIAMEVTAAEKIAQLITMLAPVLLGVGMVALWSELQSPGIGLGAAVFAVCLVIFLFGHHVAGLAGHEDLALLVLGIILLCVELFVIPGFGITGVVGLGLIFGALLSAMTPHFPTDPWYPSLPQLRVPLLNLCLTIVIAGVLGAVLGRYLPESRAFYKRLVLDTATKRTEGFTASADTAILVGLSGLATSDLHPAGTGMFGERKLDVITRGEYIQYKASIRIVETHGNRIIVEQADA